MPCDVKHVPGLGTTFICGSRPRRQKCAHCECPDAKALCDWPVMKPVPFEPYDAICVDQVLVQASGWRARILRLVPEGQVVWVKASVFDWGQQRRAQMQTTEMPESASRRARYERFLDSLPFEFETSFGIGPANYRMFRVEAKGTCDKPCCFRCRRHVAKDVDYCMDHWDLDAPETKAQGELFLRSALL